MLSRVRRDALPLALGERTETHRLPVPAPPSAPPAGWYVIGPSSIKRPGCPSRVGVGGDPAFRPREET